MKFGYLFVAPMLAASVSASAAELAAQTSAPAASKSRPAAEPIVHTPETDVQCYLIFKKLSAMRAKKDPNQTFESMSLFYHGRVSAQFHADELKPVIIAESLTSSQADIPNLLTHCMVFLVEQENIMKTIAEQMKKASPVEVAEALKQKKEKDAAAKASTATPEDAAASTAEAEK